MECHSKWCWSCVIYQQSRVQKPPKPNEASDWINIKSLFIWSIRSHLKFKEHLLVINYHISTKICYFSVHVVECLNHNRTGRSLEIAFLPEQFYMKVLCLLFQSVESFVLVVDVLLFFVTSIGIVVKVISIETDHLWLIITFIIVWSIDIITFALLQFNNLLMNWFFIFLIRVQEF
jgi:hypothetical protein